MRVRSVGRGCEWGPRVRTASEDCERGLRGRNPREECEDAQQILSTHGGVVKSLRENKMNEINPHKSWAKKVVNRAKAYGVIEDDSDYLKLILGGGSQ